MPLETPVTPVNGQESQDMTNVIDARRVQPGEYFHHIREGFRTEAEIARELDGVIELYGEDAHAPSYLDRDAQPKETIRAELGGLSTSERLKVAYDYRTDLEHIGRSQDLGRAIRLLRTLERAA